MGVTVILIGVAMLILPGPGTVVIPIGLAILATEYAWARRWLRWIRENAEKGAEKLGIDSYLRERFGFGKKDGKKQDPEADR